MIVLAVPVAAAAIVMAVWIYQDLHPKHAGPPRSMESLLAQTGKLWLLMYFPWFVLIAILILFGRPSL